MVIQNGNGYEGGFTEALHKPVLEYWQEQTPQTEGQSGILERTIS